MNGGGNSSSSSNEPWLPAQSYLKDLMSTAYGAFQESTTNGYTGLTEEQRQALTQMQDYYQNVAPGLVQTAQSGWQNLMRDPTEVAQSQEVKDMIAANLSGINANLLENVLPGVRSGATAAGQYGGTRQGVAEGVAAGKAAEAGSNAAANITGNVYQQALQAQLQSLGMAPMVGNLGNAANQGLFDVGQIWRNEENAKNNFTFDNLNQWANLLYPVAGLGSTSTGTTSTAGISPWQGVAGGATAGSAFGPWGAAIGGVLGGLSTQV